MSRALRGRHVLYLVPPAPHAHSSRDCTQGTPLIECHSRNSSSLHGRHSKEALFPYVKQSSDVSRCVWSTLQGHLWPHRDAVHGTPPAPDRSQLRDVSDPARTILYTTQGTPPAPNRRQSRDVSTLLRTRCKYESEGGRERDGGRGTRRGQRRRERTRLSKRQKT